MKEILVEGNVLTMYFTDTEGKQVEAVDTVAIADGVMTLVGASNETISLTYVETAEAPAAWSNRIRNELPTHYGSGTQPINKPPAVQVGGFVIQEKVEMKSK